jgi:hypothetical protein
MILVSENVLEGVAKTDTFQVEMLAESFVAEHPCF